MLKTISAALIAVSMIAAPAFAGEAVKTAPKAPAPVSKTAPVIKSEQLPSKVLNANAKMGHHKHYRHHRNHHKHMGMLKVKAPKFAKHHVKHVTPKVATKHIAQPKRG